MTTTTAPIVYRPLDESFGDPEALARLRAIRAERTAAHEHELALVEAADARARARRAHRTAGRHQRPRRGVLAPLPA